jgi:hypothetical protein
MLRRNMRQNAGGDRSGENRMSGTPTAEHFMPPGDKTASIPTCMPFAER